MSLRVRIVPCAPREHFLASGLWSPRASSGACDHARSPLWSAPERQSASPAGSALLGELRPGALTTAGWRWLACLALVSTVAAISLFFAGLHQAGATTASILATVEPLVAVALALLIFGEELGVGQLAGGALVLSPKFNPKEKRDD